MDEKVLDKSDGRNRIRIRKSIVFYRLTKEEEWRESSGNSFHTLFPRKKKVFLSEKASKLEKVLKATRFCFGGKKKTIIF